MKDDDGYRYEKHFNRSEWVNLAYFVEVRDGAASCTYPPQPDDVDQEQAGSSEKKRATGYANHQHRKPPGPQQCGLGASRGLDSNAS